MLLNRGDDMLVCVPTFSARRMLRLTSEALWALEMCEALAGFGCFTWWGWELHIHRECTIFLWFEGCRLLFGFSSRIFVGAHRLVFSLILLWLRKTLNRFLPNYIKTSFTFFHPDITEHPQGQLCC